MTKPKKIEILVVSHKPSYVPKNNLLKSIQVGVDVSNKKIDGMAYYDNGGKDNISAKNRSYCELTAIYWAWKNLEADYYGLFHYRRYLSFSKNQDKSGLTSKAYCDVESAAKEINLDESYMRKLIGKYDLIIPKKEDTIRATDHKSIYDQYSKEHYIKDLDFCLSYIEDKYPEVAKFNNVLKGRRGYFCNMFIMKKELFNDYCSFMFDVLGAFDKNTNISQYSLHQYRVDGFIAERLTDIYIHYLKSKKDLRVKELQIAFFTNTDPKPIIKPVAKTNNIPIVLAANNYYVPYISSLIHSIASNSSTSYTYDINIFHADISNENMNLLKNEFADRSNFSIRFCDMSSYYEQYKKLFTRGHFALETYFRLFIQDIMSNYNKVLYLDGDMVVMHDVAELYNSTDVDGYLMAAALDPDTAGLYNGFEPQKKNYMDNILKIKNPYEYFQAGVILFNLDEMRKTLKVDELLEFASSYKWELLDQDVLNYIAQGKTKFIDMSWNIMYDWRRIRIPKIISLAPISLYLSYMEARKHPKIIHYAGPEKPWHNPECDYATIFWNFARQSVFYEVILARMGDWRIKNISMAKTGVKRRVANGVHKTANKARGVADIIAPEGTVRRRPITASSRVAKRVIRKVIK